jgi:hypothetical protein
MKKKKCYEKNKEKKKMLCFFLDVMFLFFMFGFKVICWALLFIFKLRFPPGVSIATVLKVYTFTNKDGSTSLE